MVQTQRNEDTTENTYREEYALPEHSSGIRIGRDLLKATEPFAHESVAKSWWYVSSTFALMISALVVAGAAPWWPVRLSRCFIYGARFYYLS